MLAEMRVSNKRLRIAYLINPPPKLMKYPIKESFDIFNDEHYTELAAELSLTSLRCHETSTR